jgi:sarcosine oxidase
MPSGSYDAIIIGLGAMGSAAAYHLAKAGQRVLGLDRYRPPHAFGSSHGQTRIIREAYFEHPAYVPLVQRAYELWSQLERESKRHLFTQTGGLMIGPPDGVVFNGARRSAEEHRLPHEILTGTELERRFPGLKPGPDKSAVWEPRAGILFPERCVEAHLEMASRCGADLRFDEPVRQWAAEGAGVRVLTSKDSYSAGQLLCCAGAWTSDVLAGLDLPLQVERQVQYWFEPARHPEFFLPANCPIHLWEYEPARFFYGFPNLGEGVKVAGHHEGAEANPERLDREVPAHEVEQMRQIVNRFLPAATGALRSTAVCMYTNTPDGHFLLDRHPEWPQVLLASPCSGHGFKFSSAIGEALAELLLTRKPRLDLKLFSRERFSRPRV